MSLVKLQRCSAAVLTFLMMAGSARGEELLEHIRGQFARGEYRSAIRAADRALASNPDNVDVMVVYGYGMLWKKDFDTSETLFRRVLEIAPDYGDAAIGIIKTYTWSNRMDELRKFIGANGVRLKSSPYTRREILLAELRLEQADHPEDYTPRAVEIANAILKEDPKNKPALAVTIGASSPSISKPVREAERAVVEKRLTDAEQSYARALEIDPKNDDVRLAWARVLSWNGKYDGALKAVEQVVARDPRNTDAMNIQARIHAWSDDLPHAEAIYRNILEINPADIDARQGLVDVLGWQGKFEEARGVSAQLVSASPDDEVIASTHARILGQTGKHGEAIAFLQSFLDRHPDAPQARAELSNEFVADKRFGDAVNELRKSIQLDGNNKDNYLALGKLYSWQDKTEEAAALYQSVLDHDPENLHALIGLGNTYRYAGLKVKATEYYERALAVDPRSLAAQDAMRLIREAGAPQTRLKYSFSRYDDADPPNRPVQTRTFAEERSVDYRHCLSPDNTLLFKSDRTNLFEKNNQAVTRTYSLTRESLSARWNRQWDAKFYSVFSASLHEYRQDAIAAISPLPGRKKRGDYYGLIQLKAGPGLTTVLYSQDDYITSQNSGNLQIGDIASFDITHQRDVAPGLRILAEASTDRFSVSRATRETRKGSLTYTFPKIDGLGIEGSYKRTTASITRTRTARLFWAKYYPETKIYIYAHYKYEYESLFHDAFHEGDLLYSGPLKGNTEYTAEVRYTDYFSGDQSWVATGYITYTY